MESLAAAPFPQALVYDRGKAMGTGQTFPDPALGSQACHAGKKSN